MSKPVTTQWEINHTASLTLGGLRNIIKSLSVDNVQPQALFAARCLGSRIRFSSTLHSDAMIALKGNESLRMENLKIVLGLSGGGTIKEIRASTSLIGFFLFVCAWKPCLTNSDIGDLAFHMIDDAQILKEFPVAPFQLSDLIQSFSGHCEALIPVDLMHELAVEINECAPDTFNFYRPLETEVLGRLLIQIFDLLIDESVAVITLSGQKSGLWLATFFRFLIPEDTLVSIGDKVVWGPENNAKLKLELVDTPGTTNDYWTIKEWREEKVTAFVIEEELSSAAQCSYIPLNLVKSYFTQLYTAQLAEVSIANANSAMGEVAAALVILLSEFGSVYQNETCCNDASAKCQRARLIDIFPAHWAKGYSSVLKRYGWDESIAVGQRQLFEILRSQFEPGPAQTGDGKEAWRRVESKIEGFLADRLGKEFSDDEYDAYQPDTFISPALYIAVDAVITATCHFESGTQRIPPLCKKAYRFSEDCIASFLSFNGMELSEYRRHALAQVLPGNSQFDDSDIVVSSNGYVAGINPLWDLNAGRDSALAIRVINGVIKRDGISYKSIRQDNGYPVQKFREHSLQHLELFRGDVYLGAVPRSEDEALTVQMAVAVAGTELHLKTYLTARGKYLNPLSWTDSIRGLVFAKHVTDIFGYTLRQEEALARRYKSNLSQVYWQSSHLWGPDDSLHSTILKTFQNSNLKFFSAGLLYTQRQMVVRERCFTLVVQHSGGLLSGILAGEETDTAWAVLC